MQPLTEVQEKFILHWGTMGAQWGINRTVAQIHALLFISPKPLPAEDIAARYPDVEGIERLFNTLGAVNYESGDYQQSKIYFEKA